MTPPFENDVTLARRMISTKTPVRHNKTKLTGPTTTTFAKKKARTGGSG